MDRSEFLGKVGYEAYCELTGWKSAVTGAPLPKWIETPQVVREAWVCAAKAVIANYVEKQK